MKTVSRGHFNTKNTSIRPENKDLNEKVFNISKHIKKENILNDANTKQTFETLPTNIYIYTSHDIGECHHCRHSYTGNGIGIPVKRIDVQKNNLSSTVYYNLIKDKTPECKILYIVKDCFCSFECAYANILQCYSHNKLQEDILGYFMELFNTSHPGKTLIPAGDYRLTKKFGGSLAIEEFRKNGHRYKQLNNIICVPEITNFQLK